MNTQAANAGQRMHCMEIWGGNQAADRMASAPGIDAYVLSEPFEKGCSGGDVHYLTSCASGRITRMLLADISGHGTGVSALAIRLRDLLRDNVNTIDQQRMVEAMNEEFGKFALVSAFATAVVVTYFEPARSLAVCLAGHPPPIYYRADSRRWDLMALSQEESKGVGNRKRLANIPFGVRSDVRYPNQRFKTAVGDMVLLYSDAFIEVPGEHGGSLGPVGLTRLLNELPNPQPADVIPFLRQRFAMNRSDAAIDDDATLILGAFSATRVRLIDNLVAPFRLLRPVTDQTQFAPRPDA